MSFTIDVTSDINKIARYIDAVEKRQLPFALSLTLNKLAIKAQEYICHKIPQIFNNSNKWYDKHQRTGIKVSFCNKRQLVSGVYTRAHFAYIHEEGGIKRPYSSSNLAVPTMHVPKRQRSSKALKGSQADRSIFKLGSSIYKRISSQRLQRLYSLTPQAKIHPRFGFKKMAERSFNQSFDQVFTKNFNYAMRTAK